MGFATNWTSEEGYMILYLFLENSAGIPRYQLSCKCLVHHYLDLLVFHSYGNTISIIIKYEN